MLEQYFCDEVDAIYSASLIPSVINLLKGRLGWKKVWYKTTSEWLWLAPWTLSDTTLKLDLIWDNTLKPTYHILKKLTGLREGQHYISDMQILVDYVGQCVYYGRGLSGILTEVDKGALELATSSSKRTSITPSEEESSKCYKCFKLPVVHKLKHRRHLFYVTPTVTKKGGAGDIARDKHSRATTATSETAKRAKSSSSSSSSFSTSAPLASTALSEQHHEQGLHQQHRNCLNSSSSFGSHCNTAGSSYSNAGHASGETTDLESMNET